MCRERPLALARRCAPADNTSGGSHPCVAATVEVLMKRLLASMAALALLAPSALAQVKTSDITIKSGDEEIKAFLAVPEGKGPFPAVVVIQEWWGLNDWIQDNAKRLAEKGYVALAPDLYRGKVTDDAKVAK